LKNEDLVVPQIVERIDHLGLLVDLCELHHGRGEEEVGPRQEDAPPCEEEVVLPGPRAPVRD
jgi:hypothetical protein